MVSFLTSEAQQSNMSSQESNNATPQSPPNKPSDPLLSTLRTVVTSTNSTLATFERTALESSNYFVSRLRALASQGKYFAGKAVAVYDKRGYYGPQLVVGSAAVGALVGVTRGRAAAVLCGGLGGLAAYENVYGLSLNGGWKDRIAGSGGK